ncbi:FAD/NAD(P)-binding protein [Streptomyces bauhiniae]|uniref:FAD/NAD(P)-binding protein n=1 Tax=Streptomyces bauhiniae TaxID=2340725 RepID=UPI0037D33A10
MRRDGEGTPTPGVRQEPLAIAVIGAGLYGLSTVERLIANTSEFALTADREVHIHLIDPWLGRGSLTWRADQPPQLWMNSHAGQMTLFTDDMATCAGPVRKGPTLQEWAAAAGETLSTDASLDCLVDGFSPHRWASRSLMGRYMDWFLDHVSEKAPANVRVHRHRKLAVDIRSVPEVAGEAEAIWFADESSPLLCQRVILAQGAPSVAPDPAQIRLRRALSAVGGSYVPPGHASPAHTRPVKPGDTVLLRGLGLTFYDYVQLLTTARGGRFIRAANGTLTYRPSGEEPRILAVSRTGIPPHPTRWRLKTGRLTRCVAPRFFSYRTITALARSDDIEAATREAIDRMSAELDYFYYSELLVSDPSRHPAELGRFQESFTQAEPGSQRQREVVAEAVPPEERLDFQQLLDPLRGRTFIDSADLQSWMRRYLAGITNRTLSKRNTADLALITGVNYVSRVLVEALRAGQFHINPEYYATLLAWVRVRARLLTGGAPWPRQLELQALSRCGVVTFLGRASRTEIDADAGSIVCESENFPGQVRAGHLIEARHSTPSVTAASDPLRRALYSRGEITELGAMHRLHSVGAQRVAVDRHGALITAGDEVSRTRYAVGTDTSNPILTPGLPRAEADSDVFHMTDAVARYVLASVVPTSTPTATEEQ